METIPQEQVLDSLRLFAKEVMPKFQDKGKTKKAPARAAAKVA